MNNSSASESSSRPRFRPSRKFEEIPTTTAVQDGIKNITLYPNIEPRVSQYVRLDLPNSSRRCNVLFDKYPSKINLKDINLDLEDGYVVSQNYQREETKSVKHKESLNNRMVGRQVTLEYVKDGEVKRSYTGELIRRHGGIYYLKENAGVGRGYNLRSLAKPDNVVYHGFQEDEKEIVEELNPTTPDVLPACFKIQVANTREASDVYYEEWIIRK